MTWALEGNPIQGGFIPYLASQTSAEWTTSDILNRNQVFETTPAVLTSSVNLFDISSSGVLKGLLQIIPTI